MRFIRGFVIGAIFGVAVGSTISEQQRGEVAARASAITKRRLRQVGDTAPTTTDVADEPVAASL